MKNQKNRSVPNRTKNEIRYLLVISSFSLLVFVTIVIFVWHWQNTNTTKDRVIIRIFPQSDAHVQKLRKMKLLKADPMVTDFVEVSGRLRDVLELTNFGIPSVIVAESNQNSIIESLYPDYKKMVARISSLSESFPNLVKLEKIGQSQFKKQDIYAVKISGNPHKREDEPSVLFMAGHHAGEPAGIQVCLSIMEHILNNRNNPTIQKWLQQMAIWLVPCVNPDGYDYLISNQLEFPWWRKNLRDNDGDGTFEFENDGVDLNRNYDFNWSSGGSPNAGSRYFRGLAAGSENEVQAIKKLARRERFVLAVDYHSFGEAVLYPWSNEMKPPDTGLIKNIAQNLAGRLKKIDRDKYYGLIPLNGKSGQSANWLYASWRTAAFIIEIGPEYFPDQLMLQKIVDTQLDGVEFLLDRVLTSSISGHIRDKNSRKPLQAIVQLEHDFSPIVEPTRSDPEFGGFWRLVLPGKYFITVSADGYQMKKLPPVLVNPGRNQRLEISMEKNNTNE